MIDMDGKYKESPDFEQHMDRVFYLLTHNKAKRADFHKANIELMIKARENCRTAEDFERNEATIHNLMQQVTELTGGLA